MAIFKCKMCGGTIEFKSGDTVGICDSCGTKQTLPRLDDDRRANLYDRANHFRRNNEFDKAMGIYEQILSENNEDAEAYWSLVLCRYGIEYVKDPATGKRVPTVNRAQYTSIFDDDNYKSALKYADAQQKAVYEEEATAINEIQKGILAISQKEEPFDVFICYKETDENGRRTQDSVLANDLYHQLTQEGFKVFFSRITLEDKLGTAYEPYIFAALNSAKVMVVIGTKQEYFNAVWVKNEWSRYLALIKGGAKKMLIPAYRDMDPYDLPEEFSHLQAQDMGKLGFMQDLIRGIKKLTENTEKTVVRETVTVNGDLRIAPLLKRTFMFLEDGNWEEADKYAEKVLDMDPECAEAYLCKLMAELKVKKRAELANCARPFKKNGNYEKACRFGDEKINAELKGYIKEISFRIENAEKLEKLDCAKRMAKNKQYEGALRILNGISGLPDVDVLINYCNRKIQDDKIKHQEEMLERERQDRIKREKRKNIIKRGIKISAIVIPVVAVIVTATILINQFVIPTVKYESTYKDAIKMLENKDYKNALLKFKSIYNYKDSKKYIDNFVVEAEETEEIYSYDAKEYIQKDFNSNGNIVRYESNLYTVPYDKPNSGIYEHGVRTIENYEYDSYGNCIKKTHSCTMEDLGYYVEEYTYSSDGNLMKVIQTGVDPGPYFRVETNYEYDNDGKCIKKILYQNYSDAGSDIYSDIIKYEYDTEGRCVKVIQNGKTINEYKYDVNGNCIKKVGLPNVEHTGTETREYIYDKSGKCTKETRSNDNNTYTIVYTYNERGECISNLMDGEAEYCRGEYLYAYDSYGNIIRSEREDDYDMVATYSGIHVRYVEDLPQKKFMNEILGINLYEF